MIFDWIRKNRVDMKGECHTCRKHCGDRFHLSHLSAGKKIHNILSLRQK